MPSFVCDTCQETLKKNQLDNHFSRCSRASFSCIDCYTTFKGTEYRSHTSCITEVQKYHGKAKEVKETKEIPKKTPINKFSGIEGDFLKLLADKPLSLKKIKSHLKKKHSKKIVKRFLFTQLELSLLNKESKELSIKLIN
jgi:cell growth-regulating nucleolar protein